MRLIDADALAYEILSKYGTDGGTEDVNTIYEMIINAPTIDAKEIAMTKEEAIDIIRQYECCNEHIEACEMAIEALLNAEEIGE